MTPERVQQQYRADRDARVGHVEHEEPRRAHAEIQEVDHTTVGDESIEQIAYRTTRHQRQADDRATTRESVASTTRLVEQSASTNTLASGQKIRPGERIRRRREGESAGGALLYTETGCLMPHVTLGRTGTSATLLSLAWVRQESIQRPAAGRSRTPAPHLAPCH